ncbi:Uncharacterised protein [Candidatus Tiddalikarchaeum anstoanum]|nr:Uncharacterised protein [Candidatus Tiddalikarchaeum anstoanum]
MIDLFWTIIGVVIAGVGLFFYFKRTSERIQGAGLSEGIVIGILIFELIEIVMVEFFGFESNGFGIAIGAAAGLGFGKFLETRKNKTKSKKTKR